MDICLGRPGLNPGTDLGFFLFRTAVNLLTLIFKNNDILVKVAPIAEFYNELFPENWVGVTFSEKQIYQKFYLGRFNYVSVIFYSIGPRRRCCPNRF